MNKNIFVMYEEKLLIKTVSCLLLESVKTLITSWQMTDEVLFSPWLIFLCVLLYFSVGFPCLTLNRLAHFWTVCCLPRLSACYLTLPFALTLISLSAGHLPCLYYFEILTPLTLHYNMTNNVWSTNVQIYSRGITEAASEVAARCLIHCLMQCMNALTCSYKCINYVLIF